MAEKSIESRKKRWEKCKYGAPGGLEDTPYKVSIYCCTNTNIGRRWRLDRWQDYIKDEGSEYRKYANLSHQAYSRFGTYDVYVLRPTSNLVECEECTEYKRKKNPLSYW